jgi:MFS family permease
MIRAGRTVAVPLYAADVLGFDAQMIGFLEGVSGLVDAAMSWPAGTVMDRVGRKWAIVPSFAIQAAGMAIVPFTGTAGQLLAAMCVYSVGNGLGSGSMMTLGADLAPGSARGKFLGVWRLVGDAGSGAGPIAVGGVADLLVLPAAVLVMSAAGFAAAGVFAFFVPETLHGGESRPSYEGEGSAG